MDSVDITSLCASLTINSCDGPVQLLDGRLKEDAISRLSLCMVGRILTCKRVNREAFMQVIGKIWKVSKGVNIESVLGNTFAFHFGDESDLNRVLAGSPWSFDNALLALERPVGKGTVDNLSFSHTDFWVQIHQIPLLCMTREIGGFLGGLIGLVLDVDRGSSGDCVGKFMRVRIRVDITRPLKRCLRVDILGDGTETVMVLRYERLPNHCFRCGMVNHTTTECTDVEPIPITDGKEVPLYGAWLRASVGEDDFSKKDSSTRKEGVIHEVSISKIEAISMQLQSELVVDVENLGKENIIFAANYSMPVLSNVPQQSELPANSGEKQPSLSTINNEVMVEVADELDVFGPLEKPCGPIPSFLVLQPSSDMGSKKATVEPTESIYILNSKLDSTKKWSCSGSNSAVDSIISKQCGKRKEKVVQLADEDRIKKARSLNCGCYQL
ncbi:hypothetical protein EZV62_016393 [Acer yangbiense]|uniref:CCHC-type domain-containing protein n=1 Tax=Acer yangbiense TaxID=1000413 RepID=A0A5C7HP11_9ROSI|nr:hypothetical protein EZV62_016393 [Acer yangbiense]